MGELTSGGRPRRFALSLPRTGSSDGPMVAIALGLLAGGALLVTVAGRRRHRAA